MVSHDGTYTLNIWAVRVCSLMSLTVVPKVWVIILWEVILAKQFVLWLLNLPLAGHSEPGFQWCGAPALCHVCYNEAVRQKRDYSKKIREEMQGKLFHILSDISGENATLVWTSINSSQQQAHSVMCIESSASYFKIKQNIFWILWSRKVFFR